MKVYELMAKLEGMPSGADVKYSKIIPQSVVDASGVINPDGGEDVYDLTAEVNGVHIENGTIYLS